ncbi:helix-turn-helix domain-containing protein [Pseudomonas putida CSV86]|uniref:Helix-turn-helix domain-containing protein n=1 Tax=Pseudomonas bharatica CSV86 TaxID=1005395 RepID=L1LSA3_9PSED|nr:helix-turn-helix domain-containing protein [Pseudomonas bharatica]NNJ15870.1 helix-turn-helix domain-containing protein [Pseudomonas bharatica CSV86]
MPSSVLHHQTLDIEEHAKRLAGWQLRYDQLTPGRFAGQLSELRLDRMQLVRDRANQAMVKNGATWPGAVSFSMPLDAHSGDFHCAGHAISGQNLLVARGQNLPELRAPAGLDLLSVSIDETLLEQTLHQQRHGFDLDALPRCYRLQEGGSQTGLIELFQGLFAENALQASLLGHQAIRDGIRDTVLMHLLDLVDQDAVQPLPPSARKRMVDRAREVLLATPDNPPSIVELCNRIGASRRKLQYCFQETLGINPLAYLRTLRLNAVHRALLEDHPAPVQDVAAHWGFWHLSRFASDYRQLFGELPSETRRRNRGCADSG